MNKKEKTLLWIIDLLVLVVVIGVTVFYMQRTNADKVAAEEAAYVDQVHVLKNVAYSYLSDSMNLVANLSASLDGREMTEEEAMEALSRQPINPQDSLHLIWAEELEGYSTRANASDAGDFAVSYQSLRSIFSDEDGAPQITKRYINPVDGFPSIAVYHSLLLRDADQTERRAYLLYVIPEERILQNWAFPTSYGSKAHVSLVKNDGTYILRPTEMKNESFFDYIYSYNRNEVDTRTLFSQITAGEDGYFYGVDYRGERTLFTYSAVAEDMPFAIITAISQKNIGKNGQNGNLQLVAIIFVSMIVLLFANILVFSRLERELRKNEENLTTALALTKQASRAKTDFLNNMSHDIRTPMNAIIGYTELAEKHTGDAARVKDYLAKISLSSKHLLSLINDILEMSRIESGRVRLTEAEEHLPDILHNMRTLFHAEISAKNMEFFMDASDVKDENVICDKLRLNQILINLLSNAIKFTKPGGKVGLRIIQKNDAPPETAHFEFRVIDNGIGISKEFAKHMFEPFERENNSTISRIQGTGLGLAITKNLVDMMGGTISVESEEGKGSEFVVNVTFRVADKRANKKSGVPQLVGLNALVADDDTNTCFSVCKMLEEIGMNTEWTTSGKEAVIRARYAKERSSSFAVYIIDLLIPDMNGIEVVRRIRKEIGDGAPIVILTAYDWTDIEVDARAAGVTAFCAKPLFMSELLAALRQTSGIVYEEITPTHDERRFDGKRLLLAEDNALNSEIASIMLRESGFTVDVVENGAEAVARIENTAADYYDIVLMDLRMPVMDGFEATRRIHALEDPRKAQLTIIAMTANAFDEDIRACKEAGMSAHISKPINRKHMLSVIARYCPAAGTEKQAGAASADLSDEARLRAFYREIHGDYDAVLKRLLEPKMVLRMFAMFVEDTTIEQLKASVEAGDRSGAFEAVHTLKGMSGNLSLDELYQAASALTEQLRSQTQQPDLALYQRVAASHMHILESYDRYFAHKTCNS